MRTRARARAKARKRISPALKEALYNIWRFIFMIILFGVWVLAWLVESEAIILPAWAKDFSVAAPELRAQYAAALMSCVSIVFVLLLIVAVFQMRRDNVRA
ncbi:hypothetical protein QQS21_005394 [Conoideocrella luteorostrata]|uniref:Uncharacterized protein n=1 Tax=Conoideocrella luteorostrata TaxID=1105319 RepID=A0AAJ0FTU9_9HYPO|nr:hypothetical protein QQS21_005394 [Conoideocrella luteorostrata]